MIQIIGWTILHSLWQIALIGSIYLLVKHSWQAATALKKYYLAVASLVTTFLSSIFTFGYLYQQENWTVRAITDSTLIPITNETPSTTLIPVTSNEIIVETTLPFADYLTLCLPYLVTFWGLGILYFTIRFLKSLYGVQQLQNVDNELISEEWLAKIKTFKTQLNIKKEVQVFLSLHVKEPITFGHFKPIILLPISLITGFDSAAIETILLHELAHIKRHDYLVNLGQSIIEIILFYHPLVWWLSKDIRELREHCCDDLVLSLGDNRITYVETLTALQWRKVGGVTNRLSLSASGGDTGFSRRIKRMFGVEEKRGSFRQLMGGALFLLLVAVSAFTYQKYYKPIIVIDDTSEIPYPDKELNKPDEFSFIISNGRDKKALFAELRDFQENTSTDFTFDWIGFRHGNELTGSIGGTIAYKSNWQAIHSFEVQDLEKYSLLFTGNVDQVYPPQYIENSTQQIISAKQTVKPTKNTLLVNTKTTKTDLARWAKSVLDYGVIFYFQKSIFDTNDKLIGLNGKFIGEQGYFEEFFYSLKEVELKLEVEDNFIYQPTIISKIKEKEGREVEKKLSFKTDNQLERAYEIGLLQATNEKERIVRREKLAALEERNEQFKAKPYINFIKPNFLNEESKKETENLPLSYKVTNWKALGLDSLEYSLENERHRNYGNSIAKLIPPYVAVEDSVRAMNPIYRANEEKAKSVFINGKKIAKKDLPSYMQNQLEEAIKTDIPKTKRYPKTDTTVDWLYWGDQKINLGEAYKKDENGDLKWEAPKLQVSKEVWDNNKDRPFIFQIDGDWYRVKDLDMVLLIPYQQNPTSVNFHKDYAKTLNNKAGSVFKLLARAKEKDNLYFDKIDIGLPINISMAIKIIEDNSTGFVPKTDALKKEIKKTEPVSVVVLGRKDIAIDTFKNWIQWDNLKFYFSATFKEGRDGKRKLQTPTVEISQKDWKRLYEEPFTLHLDGTWFKVKTIKEIVHVPFKKDPFSANLHQDYYKIIKDKNHRATKLLAAASINDRIYFESIDVGKDFTFGLVVKIIDNQPTNSTGYIPKDAIHFDEKDDLWSFGGYPPATQNTTSPKLKIDAFLPENTPPTSGLLWSSISDKKERVYIIDGVKYKDGWPKEIPYDVIESMNVQTGLTSQSLYGEDKVYLIKTNAIKKTKKAN